MKDRYPGAWMTRILPLALSLFLGGTPGLRADTGSGDIPLRVEPKALDFGRVNAANGPLKLSFCIANQGDRTIKIAGANSSCGCTVPRLAKFILTPHEQTTVKVEVSIAGRIGPFRNRVLVDVEGRPEPISVPIQGTIIQDLWTYGPVVQCFAKGLSPIAEATFEVRTVEWPSVEFAPPVTGQGVSIRELSRSKIADETVIRFRAVMDIPAGQETIRQDVVLTPIDKRIRGLTISVIYHRKRSRLGEARRTGTGDAKPEHDAGKVRPDRVSLGVILREEDYQFNLSGETERLRTLKLSGIEGLPHGAKVELRPFDGSKPHTARIGVRLDKATPMGPIEGRIRLTSQDGAGHTISVIGIVGPGRPSQGTKSSDTKAQAQAGH